MPSRIADDASLLYAKNLLNFVSPMVDGESKSIKIDEEDEIIKASMITKDGKITDDRVASLKSDGAVAKAAPAKAAPAKTAAKKPAAKKPAAKKPAPASDTKPAGGSGETTS